MKKQNIKRIEKNNLLISMYRKNRRHISKRSCFSSYNRIEAKELIMERLGLDIKDLTLISTRDLKKMLSSVL